MPPLLVLYFIILVYFFSIDPKEYLLKIKDTTSTIVSLCNELQEIRSQKDGLTGIDLSEKVKTSATYHNNIDDLIEQEERVLKELREVRKEWWHCREMIRSIDNQLYSDVLRYYYLLNFDSWEKVAEKVHVSRRSVFSIYGNALEEFRKISRLK